MSAEELVANITIAEDAEPGAYDVVVLTTVRKRGIGLEGFIVSTVVVGTLPGGVTSVGTDVNDNGEIVGFSQVGFADDDDPNPHHATYWFGGTLEDIGRGQARGISGDCAIGACRVVGERDDQPVLWQKQGGVWTNLVLPTEGGRGRARAINDRGDRIVGSMRLESGSFAAVVWAEIGGVWTVAELPTEGGSASAINDLEQVGGNIPANGRAVVWT
ncbi:MAG: hypothetical protein L0Z49_12830, partial [Actinobacteria bacterium]|nr:hypothetical protein [Actinomycetota bacterium]